jgi:hypothetical protein
VVDRAFEVQALSDRGFEVLYGTGRGRTLLGEGGGPEGRGGLGEEVSALDPAVLASNELWGDSVFIGTVWDCAVGEECTDDAEMTVGGCKVERGRAWSADYGCGCVAIAVRVAPWESWGVYVCAALDEQVDDEDVATCACGMEREYAVDNRVDWLAVWEGVLDETDVARGGGRVQAKMGDCGAVSSGDGGDDEDTCSQ